MSVSKCKKRSLLKGEIILISSMLLLSAGSAFLTGFLLWLKVPKIARRLIFALLGILIGLRMF